MKYLSRGRAGLAVLSVSMSAALLVACGGSTVDSDEVDASESTVAPLERDKGESSASQSSSTAPSASQSSGADPEQDRGAREIDEIPPAEPNFSAQEQAYLDELGSHDIDVKGIESSVINAAKIVCSDQAEDPLGAAVVPAVAGQIVEQDRASVEAEKVTSIITEVAQSTYCEG